MGIRASNIYDAKSKARFDLAFVTLIILLAVFATLSVLSLVAFSRLIPWMRAELKLFDVASEANLWTWANVAVLVSAANGVTTRKWRICPTFKNVSGTQVGLTVDVVAFSALRAS